MNEVKTFREFLAEGVLVLKPAGDDGEGNQLYVEKGGKAYFVKVDGDLYRCADDVYFEPTEKYTGGYRIDEGDASSGMRSEIVRSFKNISPPYRKLIAKAVTGNSSAGQQEVERKVDDMDQDDLQRVYDYLDGEDLIESVTGEREYTYEPSDFYSERGKNFSTKSVTPEQKARYRRGLAKAGKLLDDLISTLSGLPRVDHMEDLPDGIRALLNLKQGRLSGLNG